MLSGPEIAGRGQSRIYRGRIAPSPTGWLHLGHARTFWIAAERARAAGGTLVYRNEDLDRARCKAQYVEAALSDLRRLGLSWQEGPDVGGPYGPYLQSERLSIYRQYWRLLCADGRIYPCVRSRREIQNYGAGTAHDSDGEPLFPVQLRPDPYRPSVWRDRPEPGALNWRFRVPDGELVSFIDGNRGECEYRAGTDFGDFLVWRKDGVPAYEFAVVVDDHLMEISEVVRGADLLRSTARQLLLYRSFGWSPPNFYHCDLVRDDAGRRLAKRDGSRSLRSLFAAGRDVRAMIAEL